jgi:hypothetical protein
MRIGDPRILRSLVLLLAVSGLLYAQQPHPQETERSCRDFVQGFYNWYTAGQGRSSEDALKLRPRSFGLELARALRAEFRRLRQVSRRDSRS